MVDAIRSAAHTLCRPGASRSCRHVKNNPGLWSLGSHAERTLDDGTRTIKLYTMTGFDHTDHMLMVYLPRERILAEADAYTPPATPTTPLIAPKVAPVRWQSHRHL
jgi:hypothetical protein